MSRAPDTDGWVSLNDVQWMNIVNHEHAYADMSKDDAVHAAVKATEAKLREINVAVIKPALIAAAPDLLEALQLVGLSAGFQYMTHETRELISAAIAKATGEPA